MTRCGRGPWRCKVVKALVDKGAGIDNAYDDGKTPLYIASEQGHADVVRVLLDNGADASLRTSDGETALQVATRCGHTEVMSLLEGA